jgi:hypothetical protein
MAGKKRPQNAARFTRIAQQTSEALALLQSSSINRPAEARPVEGKPVGMRVLLGRLQVAAS